MLRFAGVLFTCLVLDVVLAQIHLGPIGASHEVNCYQCEDHGHDHEFPECLNHHHRCHHDEVCKIVYGDKHINMQCQKAQDCSHEIANPMRNCTGGGVEARPDECQKCCTTSDCVDDLVNLMKVELATSPNLYCPGECHADTLGDCVAHGHQCHDDQFCQISQEHGSIRGECKPDHEYHHCSEELNRHSCNAGGHHPGRCFIDCCTTNECLHNTFGDLITTMAPPVTTVLTTTLLTTAVPTAANTTSSNPGSLWERLHGDCKDQLAGDTCKQLMLTQDVCHDRLALSICPETCGLCSVINSTVCEDSVVNDGCQNLVQHEDVCSDKLSVFICPDTCNMCDELINSLITSLVSGNSTATDVPATLLPPSANPSFFPTFNCNDLVGVDCGILDGLCSTSLVNVVCPQNCEACNNVQTQTVGVVVDLASTSPATTGAPATGAPTTEAPMTTQQQPFVPTTPAPSTMMPTGQSSTMMPVNTTDQTCADHLNGLDCSDLDNVCGSALALSMCPKYCGLC